MNQPATLAALEHSGYAALSIKAELQKNLIRKIKKAEPLFPGILGYDETVVPEVENAILSGHDMILLGERGQAKTRIARGLVGLLDEYVPTIAGCEVNDNPFAPICKYCRDRLAACKGDTPVAWVPRDERYGEKLATPDVTIADLVGDIDPMKVAEGRHLSDELALHYGLIPRTNRGIFVVNELPDLHEKIQVGLFNLLEERDVQIRGHKVALALDICIIATANPEDYTSRGRIITPLKDRFGAQIRTHYPPSVEMEADIVRQEIAPFAHGEFCLTVPRIIELVIAEISQTARRKADINHASGISVRMSIHNMETVISNALRRAIRLQETQVVPRITDLMHLLSTMKGKIEWNFAEDHEEDKKIAELIRDSIAITFRKEFGSGAFEPFLSSFSGPEAWEASELTPAEAYAEKLAAYPSLKKQVYALGAHSPGEIAAALEFILEGLAITGRLVKTISERRVRYAARQ